MGEDNLFDTVDDLQIPRVDPGTRAAVGIDLAGRTHPGKVRLNNEDNFHIVQFGRYLRTLASSLPTGQVSEEMDRLGYGFVVADGVGGHAAGEFASRTAITLLIEYGLATPDWILGLDGALLVKAMERSVQRFRDVNEAIIAQAQNQPGLRGMGTTLSAALTLGDDLIVTHVGDSPVCLFRRGQLHRLTRDHTMDRLQPDPNSPVAARFRNVLSRAIGMPEAGGGPDICRYKLADGDRLLLCTDGLTDLVTDDAIARELGHDSTADEACQALINLALERGGRDNVTVIVATFRFPTEPDTK